MQCEQWKALSGIIRLETTSENDNSVTRLDTMPLKEFTHLTN